MQPERGRQSSEHVLARLNAEEKRQGRGKLKIFLGYAAGVGKTYAMLQAGQAQLKEGVDLVVGIVDTHGRKETEGLLNGLPVIPMKQVDYRGTTLEEMDIDSILKKHPQLVLVDELAHTNAPDSRHPKRYQDVEELLAAGINVYTTLNIQHLESLNDAIAQITGIPVRERLPDDVLENADEIVLIDLPPDELLKRLKEGKVYAPHQASRAMQRFFKPENLTALREIALRSATDQISQEMREQIETSGITGPWPSGERVLSCLGPGAQCERIIRSSRRIAKSLKAEWLGLFVETENTLDLPQSERDRLANNLKLAAELGCKVVTIPGNDITHEIIEYSRKHNITKIVVGNAKMSTFKKIFGKTLVDDLIHSLEDIDVYVVNTQADKVDSLKMSPPVVKPETNWISYLYAFLFVAGITLIGIPLSWSIAPINMAMLYLVVVVISAIYLGQYPSIFSAILGVIALNFFFIEQKFTLKLEDTQYLVTLIVMLLIGVVISKLASGQKDQIENAQKRQKEVIGLYEMSRDLASAHNLQAVARTVLEYVQQIFHPAEAAILISNGQDLEVIMHTPDFEPDENEMAVAGWAFKNSKAAGFRTDTLPAAQAYHQPLETSQNPIGILAIKPLNRDYIPTPDDYRVLEGVAHLAATNIERALLSAPRQKKRK